MKTPLTSSAGLVAHHPTTPTDLPAADAVFQIAGTVRENPEIGIRCPVFGSTSWKSRTRCTSGPTPVTTVFQTIGESSGMKLFRREEYPSATSRLQFGIFPSEDSRS